MGVTWPHAYITSRLPWPLCRSDGGSVLSFVFCPDDAGNIWLSQETLANGGKNKLLTRIKWNLSGRLRRIVSVGEFTLVLDFYLKHTAGTSRLWSRAFLLIVSVTIHISWIQDVNLRNWHGLFLFQFFWGLLIPWYPSSGARRCTCTTVIETASTRLLSDLLLFIISCDELLNLAGFLVPSSLEIKHIRNTQRDRCKSLFTLRYFHVHPCKHTQPLMHSQIRPPKQACRGMHMPHA